VTISSWTPLLIVDRGERLVLAVESTLFLESAEVYLVCPSLAEV